MDSEPLTREEQELLAQCARGSATRIIASLYRRAEKRNAVMELEPEDEFKVWRLKWKLGTLLALGRRVSIVPVIPFEEGGLFHPSNLKIARLQRLRGTDDSGEKCTIPST
jgi:hypothetical protein